MAQWVGHLESADGGTLFLDEIGEMPLSVQCRMLCFLKWHAIVRVVLKKTEGRVYGRHGAPDILKGDPLTLRKRMKNIGLPMPSEAAGGKKGAPPEKLISCPMPHEEGISFLGF